MQRINNKDQLNTGEESLKELLVSGLAGDTDAYHAFLKKLSAHLRAFLRKRLTGLPDEVEDLVQETLLAVHNQRHTFDVDQPLTAWIHAIVRFKLVDLLRRRGYREMQTIPLEDTLEILASWDMGATEARRDVEKLLNQLPDKQRLPIVHVKLEGRSVAESAKLTGMTESAVKIGIHRGLKILAAKIRKET